MDLKTHISVVENMLEQASKLSNVKSMKRIIREISNFQLPFPMQHYNDHLYGCLIFIHTRMLSFVYGYSIDMVDYTALLSNNVACLNAMC